MAGVVISDGFVLPLSVENATANGSAIACSVSVISGFAVGDDVDATANGTTIEVTSSILAGYAVGSSYEEQIVAARRPPDPISEDGQAFGVTLKVGLRLLAGRAVGTVTTLSIVKSGSASASALAKSAVMNVSLVTLVSGYAEGELYLSDEDQLILLLAEAA